MGFFSKSCATLSTLLFRFHSISQKVFSIQPSSLLLHSTLTPLFPTHLHSSLRSLHCHSSPCTSPLASPTRYHTALVVPLLATVLALLLSSSRTVSPCPNLRRTTAGHAPTPFATSLGSCRSRVAPTTVVASLSPCTLRCRSFTH